MNQLKEQLQEIIGLEDNWDDYGAKKFSNKILEYCSKVVDMLQNPIIDISPTARDSIQFEFTNSDESVYLEIELWEDKIAAMLALDNEIFIGE